jgi:ABC-type molybdate transport system substrate-binding protein
VSDNKTRVITIRIDEAMYDALDRYERSTGLNASTFIRTAIETAFDKKLKRKKKSPEASVNELSDPLVEMWAMANNKAISLSIRAKLLMDLAQYFYPKKKGLSKAAPETDVRTLATYEEVLALVQAERAAAVTIAVDAAAAGPLVASGRGLRFSPLKIQIRVESASASKRTTAPPRIEIGHAEDYF